MLDPNRTKKFTAKEALINLSRLSFQLKSLEREYPNYSLLIDYICQIPKPPPSLKTVSTDLGLSNHDLINQVKRLYYLVLEKEYILNFSKVEYSLHFKFDKIYYNLKLDHLAEIPKVGDTFEAFFLEGIIGIGVFTVRKISHKLMDDKQTVEIFLSEHLNKEEKKRLNYAI
ncbi:hypothetical protein ACNI3T_05415 [Christiangramia sp. ASW11-125]|uniref:hypothetical protein n=1 Tax=Christiangramia sp. ASW11-125 TaxID=3400701 RepID=UPI003AAD7376